MTAANSQTKELRGLSAVGVVFFGLFGAVGGYRLTPLLAGCLFLPAAVVAWFLPELRDAPPSEMSPAD